MTAPHQEDLWRDFPPRTATQFEERFATEEDCRAYWISALERDARLPAHAGLAAARGHTL
jgi:hypothetical protein